MPKQKTKNPVDQMDEEDSFYLSVSNRNVSSTSVKSFPKMFECYEQLKYDRDPEFPVRKIISIDEIKSFLHPLSQLMIDCYGFRINPSENDNYAWQCGGSTFIDSLKRVLKKFMRSNPDGLEESIIFFASDPLKAPTLIINLHMLDVDQLFEERIRKEEDRLFLKSYFPNVPELYTPDELKLELVKMDQDIKSLKRNIEILNEGLKNANDDLQKKERAYKLFATTKAERRSTADKQRKNLPLFEKIEKIGLPYKSETFFRYFRKRLSFNESDYILSESSFLSQEQKMKLCELFHGTGLTTYVDLAYRIESI